MKNFQDERKVVWQTYCTGVGVTSMNYAFIKNIQVVQGRQVAENMYYGCSL